jgi:hypothetical protein
MSGQFDTFANPLPLPATAPAAVQPAAECEGTACQQVTMTFDESKQQYHVQNNSSDRWVRVSASNLAAGASVCLGPGKTGFLPLKSIVEPYHADYSEPRCGAPEGVGD